MQKKLKKYNDKELVQMMHSDNKAHSELAFKELYNRHYGYVYAYCYRLVGSREVAEDIFQETFIRFYQNVKSDDNANIKSYLLTIARNLCFNENKAKKATVSIDEYTFDLPDKESDKNEQKELQELISNAIDLLSDEYKEVFVLRQYSMLSYKEIGEITETSEMSSKVRYFRAKKQLQNILEPYLNDINAIITHWHD